MPCFRLGIAAISASLALGCAFTGPPTVQQLIAHFDEVAFRDQFDPSHDVSRVRKWTGPIRISLRGQGADRFRTIVAGYAAELALLTRLPIKLVDAPGEAANFEVRFVAWDDMEQEARAFSPRPEWLAIIVEGAACLFVYRRTGDFRIVRAVVLVSTRESDDHKAECLLEEMTQALGLPNDSDLVTPSILNRHDGLTRLSPADRLLVQTLYDPRLPVGLPRVEALARARTIMSELLGRRSPRD